MLEWKKIEEETPKEDMMCLVVKKNSNYITVLNWNEHYQNWDDFDADDYYCDKEEVEFYIPFDDLPSIPDRNI